MEYNFYGLFDPRNDIIIQNLYKSDRGKQLLYYGRGTRLWGSIIAAYDDAWMNQRYMKTYGIGWNDVTNVSNMYGSRSVGSALGSMFSLSKNFEDLYR